MKRLGNKKSRWVSWFVLSKWYIITCRCTCKFSQQVYWNIRTYLAYFLSVPRLAWQACSKKKVKLELLTHFDMLLMVEKGIR